MIDKDSETMNRGVAKGFWAVCAGLVALLAWAAVCETMQPEPPGQGVAFDGKTAFTVSANALGIAVGNGALALESTAITVSAWVRLERIGESQVFLNRGRANNVFTFYLYKEGVRMLVGHKPDAYAHAVAPTPTPNVWTHYAGSYDGKTIKVYMNGEPVKTTVAPGQMETTTDPLVIGALNDQERFIEGRMEDVRVWRRVLTDDEIAAVAAGAENEGGSAVGNGALLNDGLLARWTKPGLAGDTWESQAPGSLVAKRLVKAPLIVNAKDDGYRGIWYYNQPSGDEYVYKYSGGLGTYCAKHIPHAWYVNEVNKTFFTYGGTKKGVNNRLVHMVAYYDHETGLVPRPTILLDKQTSDAHDNPVINVDDQGYIWIFSSSHGTGRPSYISRSRRPHSVDAFDLVWEGNYSYPQPWFIPGKGFLFLHTHYTQGRTLCLMTSPDGVHWSERRFLARIARGHYQVSRPFDRQKVGTAFNYHPVSEGLNWRTNLYYMETDDFGETWKSVQGEPLDLIGSGVGNAAMMSQPGNPALVTEYESRGLNVYMKDINYDSKGNPIILYLTSKGYESGPENMPRTWTTARWTGSAWDIQGGDIISDNNYDTGSLYIESDNQWRVIGPTEVGPQPYNPGGEVGMWVSRDQGKSWTMAKKMTQNSEYNHTYLRRPVNAHPDFYGFWADGHGRRPSDSRLYFCNKAGDVFRLPVTISADFEKPERVN